MRREGGQEWEGEQDADLDEGGKKEGEKEEGKNEKWTVETN